MTSAEYDQLVASINNLASVWAEEGLNLEAKAYRSAARIVASHKKIFLEELGKKDPKQKTA